MAVLMCLGLLYLKFFGQKTITGYKSEDFIIYECSRPISAKKGTVPLLFGGRAETLVPADETEAAKYCYSVGIE